MPKVKASEFRNLAEEEIREKCQALKKELLNLRFALKMGKLEKYGRIRELRREIARLLTVLNEKKSSGTRVKEKVRE